MSSMQPGSCTTPNKESGHSFLSSRIATTADTADKEIRVELRSHVYVLGERDNVINTLFFDTFLGGTASKSGRLVAEIARDVDKSLRATGHLTDSGWTSFPDRPRSEDELYAPTVKILAAITDACVAIADEDIAIKMQWLDEHTHVMQSTELVDAKPDIACVRKGTPLTDGEGKLIAMRVWWRMVQCVLEIKKSGKTSTAVVQLLRYVRQALVEQPDRRFMLSMVLAGKFLQVWHVDRSGAIAHRQFDIQEKPALLIQTIVAILVKSPQSMGWDPTMLLYPTVDPAFPNKKPKPCPSYELPAPEGKLDPEERSTMALHQRWLVTIQHEDGTKEDFVLYKMLSKAHAEVIRGRATRVWKAWTRKDYEKIRDPNQRSTYIFKDCWRDERRGLEKDLYLAAQGGVDKTVDGLARMYWGGVVLIDGAPDDTFGLIRAKFKLPPDLEPIRLQDDSSESEAKAMRKIHELHENSRTVPSTKWQILWEYGEVNEAASASQQIPQYNRIHSRLIMRDFGIPLYRFTTLPELLKAYHDAVEGHRTIRNNGVLHRDISTGNVLITPYSEPGRRGMLIDLDYAKLWKKGDDSKLHDDERTGTVLFMALDVLARQCVTVKRPKDGESTQRPKVIANDSGEMTFEQRINAAREPVFRGLRYSPPTTPRKPKPVSFQHGVLHDLESFWLVLLWICLHRSGPFTERSWGPESQDWGTNREAAAAFINEFFDDKASFLQLCENRRRLFEGGLAAFRESVIPAITPYFDPIHTLVEELFMLLCEVYYARSDGEQDRTDDPGLYNQFLKIVNLCLAKHYISSWDANLGPDFTRDELEKRMRSGFYPCCKVPAEVKQILKLPPRPKDTDTAPPKQNKSRKRTATEVDTGNEEKKSAPKKKARTTSAQTSGAPSLAPPDSPLRRSTRRLPATTEPVPSESSFQLARGRQGVRCVGQAATLPGATTRSRSKAQASTGEPSMATTRSSSRPTGKGQGKSKGTTKAKSTSRTKH